jgi:nitrogen-specific signal transduction histidine kinase
VRLWERVAYEGERPSRELTLLQDVTEQSLLQAQLRLTDRLTSLGTMAAGVAHEINNPLAFVLGNLNVVKSTLAPLTDIPDVDLVDLKDAVNEAIEGAERVRQIVQSLKAFSRVDENRRVQCDVARVMQASLNMAKNELRHRARIVNDINPVGPVLGNEAKLSQVFLNLLVNAAQAMPDGKSDENTVTVSTRDEGGEVIASVTDTGVGIPPEVLPRIFDPFFSTKKIGEGTGLGLFVSQGIIKEAGGTLTVHSTPGKGTSFEVRLPITLAAFQGSGNTPVPRAKRLRILVVDDEPAILRSIERMLSRHHELTLARSGGEALAHLQANLSYDLMLCDLMMPEISGMDLWEHLTPAQRRRCVFMTGGTFTERASRFMAEAQPPLLEKPFTSLSLEALLQGTVSAS